MCGRVAYGICSESEVRKSGVEIVRKVDLTLHFSKVKYYRRADSFLGPEKPINLTSGENPGRQQDFRVKMRVVCGLVAPWTALWSFLNLVFSNRRHQ